MNSMCSKHYAMLWQRSALLFFSTFLTLCCLESSQHSSLLQVHNRKQLGASFGSLVPPWTPHAGRRSFPFSLNKADSHSARQPHDNRSAHRPIWQSASSMPLRTLTLAQLSWTSAHLRLISSMKSSLLSSPRFSSPWASSTAFLVRIPIDFILKACKDFFFVVVVVTPLATYVLELLWQVRGSCQGFIMDEPKAVGSRWLVLCLKLTQAALMKSHLLRCLACRSFKSDKRCLCLCITSLVHIK